MKRPIITFCCLIFILFSITPISHGVTIISSSQNEKPTNRLRLLFIHHSCGENWLSNGELRANSTLNNYEVHNAYYGEV